MANANNPNTGNGSLNANLLAGAAALGGPAVQLAAGAKATDVAAQALKDTALTHLLGPTTLFATGMLAVLGTIKKIVAETGILDRGLKNIAATEQIQGKFETLLKSATLAKQRIEELYRFTANSPFKFDDVAEANRVLQALTKGALAGAQGMTLVGDAAAATGQSISDVADRVGRLYNALQSGRSLDRIIFQMQQTGLVTDTVAKQLEQLEEVGAGFGEKWGAVEKALRATEGGMQNELKTLDALTTRLANANEQLEKAFAAPFREAKARELQVKIDATENVTPLLATIGEDLAPLLTLTATFKNSITESTLATKGFAEALNLAWQIGKVAFAGIGLASLGKLTLGLGQATKFVGTTLAGTASRVAAEKATGGGLARAAELFGKAGAAVSPGGEGVAAAASFVIEATAIKAATLASITHKQAMAAVGSTTGLAAAANYAAAAATTVFAGAMSLARRVLVGFGTAVRASFAALLTNPFTATLIAVGAAVTGFLAWKRAVENAAKAYADLSEQIAETNRKLNDQVAAINTTEDWRRAVNDLTDEYTKAKDALQAFKAEQEKKSTGVIGGLVENFKETVIPGYRESREGRQRALENQAADRLRQRNSVLARVGNVGLSDREKELFRGELQQRDALREQNFNQQSAKADGEALNKIIEDRIALLKREAAEGRAAAEARGRVERSQHGQQLAATDAQFRDAQADETRARQRAKTAGLTEAGSLADPEAEAKRIRADIAAREAVAETRNKSGARTDESAFADLADAQQLKALKEQAAALDELSASLKQQSDLRERLRALRLTFPEDELTQNAQAQDDLREDIRKNPVAAGQRDARVDRLVALQKRALEVTQLSSSFGDKERAAQELQNQSVELKKQQALKELEIRLDKEIATARQKGLETASLEMAKQIKLLEKQRELAAGKPQEQRAIDAQIAQVRAGQAQFRGNAALERERNAALARGDGRTALQVDDFRELRELIAQYAANGLSEAQARADFALGKAAQGINAPTVAVDSLQAVGGGGGFATFGPGMLDLQRRQNTLTEVMVQHLARIAASAAAGGGLTIN